MIVFKNRLLYTQKQEIEQSKEMSQSKVPQSSSSWFQARQNCQIHEHNQLESSKSDKTLGELTKTFIELIRKEPSQIIQIQKAAQILKVEKRRIYDITSVLEGIGFILKIQKNKVQWIGGINRQQYDDQSNKLDLELDKLELQTKQCIKTIEQTKQLLLQQLQSEPHLLYIDGRDIHTIMAKLKISNLQIYQGSSQNLEDYMNITTQNQKCLKHYACKMTNCNFSIVQHQITNQEHFNEKKIQ